MVADASTAVTTLEVHSAKCAERITTGRQSNTNASLVTATPWVPNICSVTRMDGVIVSLG